MPKKTTYEPIGTSTIYAPKKKKGPDWGEILGGVVLVFFVLALLASCGG